MEIKLRQARKEDISTLLQIYEGFIRQFVGSAARTPKTFQRMLKRKDNIVYVACDGKSQIIGYVYARINKRTNRGEFEEIVVDPRHNFENVAKPLVEKVNSILVQKHVLAIIAGSIRNPAYEKIFPELGFSKYESLSVFMYSVLNVQKFLNELSPVFVNRLQRLEQWSGTLQLECEGHSIFLQKTKEGVQPIVWTNQRIDFKTSMPVSLLTKLIFGAANASEAHRTGQLKIEHATGREATDKMLNALFPRRQFLIMDNW